jgi:DNA-binding SARP family transcriptional activator
VDRWLLIASPIWALGVVLMIWVVVVDVLTRESGRSPVGVLLGSSAEVVGLFGLLTVGAVVAWLRPSHPVGWLMLTDGLVWIGGIAHSRYAVASTDLGPGFAVVAAFYDGAGWVIGLGLIGLVLLLIPTGRESSRRWRLVRWLIVGGGGTLALSNLLTPGPLPSWPSITNPLGVEGLAGVAPLITGIAEPVFFVGFIAGLVSVVFRFRRASGVERQQLRWLVFAVAVMLLGFALGALLTALGLPGEPWLNTLPMMFALPIAIGIAVLRHRLWDLDLVVYRGVTYGLVALAITAIYVLMVAAVGAAIGGGTRSDVGLAVLATAMAAAIFQPAREMAQAAARRLLFVSRKASPPTPVTIRTLGGFRLERDGLPVPASEWQSKKARQLLKVLVARRGRPVHREQLMESLWPGEDVEKLSNRLSVAASTVRAVLDPTKAYPPDHYIKGEGSTLRVDLDNLESDLEAFLIAADTALRSGGEDLKVAEAMYRGDFLEEDLYEDWSQPPREEARGAYLAVLRARAEAERDSDVDAAAAAMLKILEIDPWDESAHLSMVSTLTEAGRHGEARRAYRRYVLRMEELGLEPVQV